MLLEPIDTVVSLIGASGSIVAAIALGITALTFHRARKTEEVRLAESVFKDIRALEKDLSDTGNDIKRKNSWRSQFFNTLEWLSFLINEKKMQDKKVINFYRPAIIEWYEKIFEKYMGDVVHDPKEFPEFKKLYDKFKS